MTTTDLIRALPLMLMLAFAGPALAQTETEQDTGEDTEQTESETPADPLGLSMGEEDGANPEGPGSIYVRSSHGDWEIRCIRAPEGSTDPCQLYQLLTDPQGNPVSEINIFPLDESAGGAAAGATVVTPLETLLTAELALQVDSGGIKKYPFSWCASMGCFARLGFTGDDVQAFKAGNVAKIIIVPVAAPDQRVALEISLTGFTAAYAEAQALQPQ